MIIDTTRFGEVEISDKKIINFQQGIPGFDSYKRFALITTEETEPFHWLQSIEESSIALAVINPFALFPDYAPRVSQESLDVIGDPSDDDIFLLTVAVIPSEPVRMTTNLVSPILINTVTNEGTQTILENSEYQIRQPIFNEVKQLLLGGEADAGADA